MKGFENMDNRFPFGLVASAGVALALVIGSVALFDMETIKGNEIGVRETFSGGIDENVLGPKTYFRNRLTSQIYHYSVSSMVFTMNDVPNTIEKGHGRGVDAYLVQSSDQQDMHISLNVRWKIDPTQAVALHKTFHAHIGNSEEEVLEERLIRPTVMLIVKNHATKMKAMEAYSGEGLVRLQTEIETDLAAKDGELRKQGVIVENFVIEKIALDPNYTAEIKARQIAQQKKLRADEETKAAEADALKAKAVAQANLNTAVVEAQRDKEVGVMKAKQLAEVAVTAATAAKEQTILEAEANAKKVTLAANAEKEAAEAQASAIAALGKANAEAQRLKFSAYSAVGADNFVRIEVAKSLSQAFGGIKGYLPSDMKINLLTENYNKSLSSLMGLMDKDEQRPVPVSTPK
jgi:regulator of protease activity HflC (stomatin/prohibitin superfamily)